MTEPTKAELAVGTTIIRIRKVLADVPGMTPYQMTCALDEVDDLLEWIEQNEVYQTVSKPPPETKPE